MKSWKWFKLLLFALIFLTGTTALYADDKQPLAGTVTASNGIYEIFVEDAGFGIGTYTARTGPDHPTTLATGSVQNVLYGGEFGSPGTSFNTVRSYTSSTDYTQISNRTTTFGNIGLDAYSTGTTPIVEDGNTIGYTTSWVLPGPPATPDHLEITQDVKIIGSTYDDSAIEVTMRVTNLGSDAADLGVRYLWDFQIGDDDGPLFLPIDIVTGGVPTVFEEQRAGVSLENYLIVDNDINPEPGIFAVNGSSSGPAGFVPAPDAPGWLQNVCWPDAYSTAFDYTIDFTRDVATTNSDCRGFAGGDTAINYVFGRDADDAFTVEQGQRVSVTAYIYVTPPPPDPTDTDGDGLYDVWETAGEGVDFDGDGVIDLDLNAMGADPLHKDIFVEIDWMEDGGHSHEPDPIAIQRVIDAFANAPVANPDGIIGINLHVDFGGNSLGAFSEGNAIPHQDELGSSFFELYNWSAFDDIKRDNFSRARAPVFHYALFIHNMGGQGGTSGMSRGIGASDFIVSLGSWTDNVGTEQQQAGTFMHELGHNLGLSHGGDDHINRKPNYLSVMSYLFQTRGLTIAGIPGRLDYSGFDSTEIPDLDETNLNEAIGLGAGGIVDLYGTFHFNCDEDNPGYLDVDAGDPIDWNCDGDIDADPVRANINGVSPLLFGIGEHYTDDETLSTHDDWANLVYDGGMIGSLGIMLELPLETEANEMTPEDDAQLDPQPPASLVVTINVKPGSSRNPINPGSGEEIPVAILSTDEFDATTVDPLSVLFGPAGASEYHGMGHVEDVNGDGRVDLVLHFNTPDTGIQCGDISVSLTGQTFSGQMIEGQDVIVTVECN